MIIILTVASIFIISILCIVIGRIVCGRYSEVADNAEFVAFFDGIILIGCLIGTMIGHGTADYAINSFDLRYRHIMAQKEVVNSVYEDNSKIDVYQRIQAYNEEVCAYKYYAENPFTSWFYVRKVANEIQYIPIE